MEYYAATEKNEADPCIGVEWLPRHNVKCKVKTCYHCIWKVFVSVGGVTDVGMLFYGHITFGTMRKKLVIASSGKKNRRGDGTKR